MFVVLGRCSVYSPKTKDASGRRIFRVRGFKVKADFQYTGEHIILYNKSEKGLNYIPIEFAKAHKKKLKNTGVLKGYEIEGNKLIVDETEKQFTGKIDSLYNLRKNNTWTLLGINDKVAKLINILGEIKVVSREDFETLYKIGNILNIWITEDNILDESKYDGVEEPYQLFKIELDEEDKTALEIMDSVNKKAGGEPGKGKQSNENELDKNEVKHQDKQMEIKTYKSEDHDIPSKNGEDIKKIETIREIKQDNIGEIELYNQIIKNMQLYDIISIPINIIEKLNIRVYKVLNSVYSEDGTEKKYRRIVGIKLKENDNNNLLAITYFNDESKYIKVQAFTLYQERHPVSVGDIEVEYLKHQMELKYL